MPLLSGTQTFSEYTPDPGQDIVSSSQPSSSISTATTDTSISTGTGISTIPRTDKADLDAAFLYGSYVESLAEVDPQLQSVADFLCTRLPVQRYPDYEPLRCALVNLCSEGKPSNVAFRADTVNTTIYRHRPVPYCDLLRSLSKAIRETGSRHKVLICEDIQPTSAKYLGALLGLDARVFQYLFNRETSFESRSGGPYAFDYPETYHISGLRSWTCERDLIYRYEHARPCTLLKMWKSLHVVLVDSLGLPRYDSTVRLSDNVPTFEWYRAQPLGKREIRLSSEKDLAQRLEESLLDLKLIHHTNGQMKDCELELKQITEIYQIILQLLCSKWQLMINRVQESISETSVPLTEEIDDIAGVLQRKHDFEKLKRSLSALTASIKAIPGVAHDSGAALRLQSFELKFESWATQLEKVSQSMLGLLAVAESVRATQQAARSKNLQILAFVFLPISTVSSIYGMNTIEILEDRPHNWYFVVGAVVAIAGSAMAAIIYDTWPYLWDGGRTRTKIWHQEKGRTHQSV